MDETTENERIEALLFELHSDVPPSSLPQVVVNMKKLRWISCSYYPATSFSREFQPTKLCCLALRSSRQQQLWEGYKHLPNIKATFIS
ncbi:hypothetical protein L6452_13154 [Arctium lappa]|uniref:Uncharacterized protein n=1 Tax=Arctium lappa TaxID=4217 RepID=A0ACB9CHC3_ARCLA|nr:hypothetical protein L6452_13154 [Arctium lappa]